MLIEPVPACSRQQQAGDQVARQREEHGHAEIAARETRDLGVEQQHRRHRQRADPVERRLVRDRSARDSPCEPAVYGRGSPGLVMVRAMPRRTPVPPGSGAARRSHPRIVAAIVAGATARRARCAGGRGGAGRAVHHRSRTARSDHRARRFGVAGLAAHSPTLADNSIDRGWGPVRMRAGEGYSTGAFNTNSTWKVSNWITTWRSQGWDPVDLVINLGANDSGLCGANVDLRLRRDHAPGRRDRARASHLVAEDHPLLHLQPINRTRGTRRSTRSPPNAPTSGRGTGRPRCSPAATRRLTAPTCRPTATASDRR